MPIVLLEYGLFIAPPYPVVPSVFEPLLPLNIVFVIFPI